MRHYFQSKPYREFVKAQTCTFRLLGYLDCDGPGDPQHDPVKGIGDDLDCIPMCRKHHDLHKNAPGFYRSVITPTVLETTKKSMLRGFLRVEGYQTDSEVVKPRNRKKAEAPKTSRFQTKPEHSSKKRKTSQLRPYNWRLEMTESQPVTGQ